MLSSICLLSAAGVCCGAAEKNKPNYRKIVKAYADAMIKHGRDTYGEQHSPLFASALDRKTHSLGPEKLPRMKGIRNGDRLLAGANPMHDEDLYQLLYVLTDVTGKKKYAAEADKALKWFFNNCQSPATGLMTWGEHIGWGFKTETITFGRGDNHEFFGAWVLWDRSFKLAPKACLTFAHGLWDHQIHEHGVDFSRHAGWAEHRTGTNNGYPRHGGFYIATWGYAYEKTKDPTFLLAIEKLIDHYNKTSSKVTGAIPCSKKPSRLHIMWPESNLSLAVDLWDAADKVNEKLARKLRKRALQTDKVYLNLAHDFGPTGKGFVAGAHVDTLERFLEGAWTDTKIWATAYGKSTDAQVAMLCYERYQQTKMEGYKKLVLDSAERYLYSEPDTDPEVVLFPGSMSTAILHMIVAYELSGQKYYLDRAEYFAEKAVEIFIDDTSPLPKASTVDNQYETITGGDDLMLALLELSLAKKKPGKKLRSTYNHR